MSDHDRQRWQAEQIARDVALDKQRERERKARERSARNAQRKLERLQRTLQEQDCLSEFEQEFAESVGERLDKFGSAFHDREKGRPGDALSFAQKRVVAAMNKKVKQARLAERNRVQHDELDYPGDRRDHDTDRPKPRSSFKSRRRQGWTPRIRQLDEGFETESAERDDSMSPSDHAPEVSATDHQTVSRPPVGKPFLRIVKND